MRERFEGETESGQPIAKTLYSCETGINDSGLFLRQYAPLMANTEISSVPIQRCETNGLITPDSNWGESSLSREASENYPVGHSLALSVDLLYKMGENESTALATVREKIELKG